MMNKNYDIEITIKEVDGDHKMTAKITSKTYNDAMTYFDTNIVEDTVRHMFNEMEKQEND